MVEICLIQLTNKTLINETANLRLIDSVFDTTNWKFVSKMNRLYGKMTINGHFSI